MKDKISEICKNIEIENNVKILFAVENGSRAWRMDSKDSDYDVRFVFVRPIEEYIQIEKPEEVINTAFDKDGNICEVQGSLIDISGFDIFKYSKLLSSSNPTTIEWLMSDIVYHGEQNKIFKDFAINNFSKSALYHHYKSLCKKSYLKYIKTGELVSHKKYLYAYRGLINAKWVINKESIPPIVFSETIDGMSDVLPGDITSKLYEIIDLKSQGKEKDVINNIKILDNYIDEFIINDELPIEEYSKNLDIINTELRNIVLNQN